MYELNRAPEGSGTLGYPRQQSIRERLDERKQLFEAQLESINAALEALNKNPEFEQFHDAVIKAGF